MYVANIRNRKWIVHGSSMMFAKKKTVEQVNSHTMLCRKNWLGNEHMHTLVVLFPHGRARADANIHARTHQTHNTAPWPHRKNTPRASRLAIKGDLVKSAEISYIPSGWVFNFLKYVFSRSSIPSFFQVLVLVTQESCLRRRRERRNKKPK